MLVEYAKNGGNGFYPTPPELARKMLSKIDFRYINSFLEPSAGKGDLAKEILRAYNNGFDKGQPKIDCIEIDPYLRQIIKYNFSEEALLPLKERLHEIRTEQNLDYGERWRLEKEIEKELDQYKYHECVRVVYDDFLQYWPDDKYDAIIMNPPFDAGAKHLNHAIEIMRMYGGTIVCLLNAETIRNVCDNHRRKLVSSIEKYNADVEFISGAFSNAERKTDVDIALVTFKIPVIKRQSRIFTRLEEAEQRKQQENAEYAELITTDPIESMITRYNLEVKASIELIEEYYAMKPYMQEDFENSGSILSLVMTHDNDRCYCAKNVDVNTYLMSVRYKYWKALFHNPAFTGMLTSNLRDKYNAMLTELKHYEFNRYNINRIKVEMMAELVDGVKDTIMALFDKLSADHSWYPECQNNIHYYNGWATNKAHKINKKVIIPIHGIFSAYIYTHTFDTRNAYDLLSDMEKALNYLDGGMTEEVNLHEAIKQADASGQTKKIHCKYFDVSFYKKGTAHITFTCPDLLDKFNIYASKQRSWLPPNYGKVSYDAMSSDEKKVIDEFQGKEAYNNVLRRADYFLESGASLLRLPAAM